MPIYEYTCAACQHRFEELVRSDREARLVKCPKCGTQRVERRLSTFAAHATAERPARPPGCEGCRGSEGGCPFGER